LGREEMKLFIIVSEDWSFLSHRLSLALSAIDAGFDVTVVTRLRKFEKIIKEKGINVININFRRSSKTPLIDLYNLIKLIIIFKKEKPDIIHNVALKTILLGSVAGLFSNKSIIVNAFTGLGYVFSSSQLKARIIQILIKPLLALTVRKENSWTIFQNQADMNLFDKLNLIVLQRSVLIRGSGVDTREFPEITDVNDVPVVMLASRMLWDKGIAEFVEVAKRAYKNNINAKFLLVGDIDMDNPMSIPTSTLSKWNMKNYIEWKGYSKNMLEVLSSASIICLPSYREGLPKVLLEAAAIGRPLVATDVPGCREIVRDGYNGILVHSKDIDSLYDAIVTLVDDEQMRKKMGKNSRKLIENELSAEIINSQIIELYKKAKNINH
jgi:glycosyltransferase involved in cell wall biosynthesis